MSKKRKKLSGKTTDEQHRQMCGEIIPVFMPLLTVSYIWARWRLPFGPISSLCEKINPRNINYMPVVIFSVCLDLEPKSY